jgi:hypothetical protein
MLRGFADIRRLLETSGAPSADTIASRVPVGPLLLIVQLGSTNDAQGNVDIDVGLRAALVADLHRRAAAAGRAVLVLTSGGCAEGFTFNPTSAPHWQYVCAALVAHGLPEVAFVRPGLPALHTVEEALMCRELASHYASRAGCGELQLLVVTSVHHAARARHLFGLSFGHHAALPVACEVVGVASGLGVEERAARDAHEARELDKLRMAPNGAWLDFLRALGLEAANHSRRWSRRMGLDPAELALGAAEWGGERGAHSPADALHRRVDVEAAKAAMKACALADG